MVTAPLNFLVSHHDICNTADRLAYEGFIPFGLVTDIAYLRIYSMLNVDAKLDRPSPYHDTLYSLMDMVNAEAIETNNPIEFAINILKLISPKVNLRKMEASRFTNQPVLIDIENKQLNYKVDISSINPEHLELLGIDDSSPVNEIKLSEETLDILKFYNGMKRVSGELFPERVSQVSKLSRISDLHKVRRYRFALPSFISDVVLKKPYIRESKTVMKQNNSVVVMVDVSWSTSNNPKYYSIVKAVLLSLLDSFVDGISEITILEFNNKPVKEVVLNTKDELKGYINYKFVPVLGPKGWKNMYNHIRKYNGESVIFITDGLEDVTDFPTNIRLYVISTNHNKHLNGLCVNSGGKFVLV